MYGSGTNTLIVSSEEMNDIMETVKSLEESALSIKSITEAIKNEAKEQKEEFLGMLLGTLDASFSGNLKAQLEKVKERLEQVKIFNAAPSFN